MVSLKDIVKLVSQLKLSNQLIERNLIHLITYITNTHYCNAFCVSQPDIYSLAKTLVLQNAQLALIDSNFWS